MIQHAALAIFLLIVINVEVVTFLAWNFARRDRDYWKRRADRSKAEVAYGDFARALQAENDYLRVELTKKRRECRAWQEVWKSRSKSLPAELIACLGETDVNVH